MSMVPTLVAGLPNVRRCEAELSLKEEHAYRNVTIAHRAIADERFRKVRPHVRRLWGRVMLRLVDAQGRRLRRMRLLGSVVS